MMDLKPDPSARRACQRNASGARKTILIVDDIPEVRETYAYIFRQAGWRTFVAEDGAKCLNDLASHHVDALLLDIFMPDMDGIEVLLHARACSPNLAIVSVSSGANAWDGALLAARKLGADMTFTKSDSIETLIRGVEACVAMRAQPEKTARLHVVAVAGRH